MSEITFTEKFKNFILNYKNYMKLQAILGYIRYYINSYITIMIYIS